MTIETLIKLQPFRIPNFVLVVTKAGGRENSTQTPKYSLGDLDPATLDSLCDQFREDIFKKAGKSDPNT